jgi:hypothetical protein
MSDDYFQERAGWQSSLAQLSTTELEVILAKDA